MRKICLIPFAVVFAVFERMGTFMVWACEKICKFCSDASDLAQDFMSDAKNMKCQFGVHKWRECATCYDGTHAYALYCDRCNDCKDLTRPHAKENKYYGKNKKITL